MWNAGLDEAQAEIKIARRNINNIKYASNITLMQETKQEIKSLLMKIKEESDRASLKLSIKKKKNENHDIQSHYFMENRWASNGNSDRFYFLRLQNHCGWWLLSWN